MTYFKNMVLMQKYHYLNCGTHTGKTNGWLTPDSPKWEDLIREHRQSAKERWKPFSIFKKNFFCIYICMGHAWSHFLYN